MARRYIHVCKSHNNPYRRHIYSKDRDFSLVCFQKNQREQKMFFSKILYKYIAFIGKNYRGSRILILFVLKIHIFVDKDIFVRVGETLVLLIFHKTTEKIVNFLSLFLPSPLCLLSFFPINEYIYIYGTMLKYLLCFLRHPIKINLFGSTVPSKCPKILKLTNFLNICFLV